LLALDREDGGLMWQAVAPGGGGCGGSSDEIAASDGIVVGCEIGTMHGMEAHTGEERWSRSGECYAGAPFAAGDALLTSSALIDITTGETRWSIGGRDGFDRTLDTAPPVVGATSETVVYLAGVQAERYREERLTLVARDRGSGDELWRRDLGEMDRRAMNVATGDGVIGVTGYEWSPMGTEQIRYLLILDARSGRELHRLALDFGEIEPQTLIINGYVVTWQQPDDYRADTRLTAIDVRTGTSTVIDVPRRAEARLFLVTDGAIVSSGGQAYHITGSPPAIAGVFWFPWRVVGAGDGRIYGAQSGRPRLIDY
jgi:outer membrane protein assembly factor BamB